MLVDGLVRAYLRSFECLGYAHELCHQLACTKLCYCVLSYGDGILQHCGNEAGWTVFYPALNLFNKLGLALAGLIERLQYVERSLHLIVGNVYCVCYMVCVMIV